MVASCRLDLPLPPPEMRDLVGETDTARFDNPTGGPVFPGDAPESYESFFDFGCGCGRIARQLAQMVRPPNRYLGIDLHAGMIDWCTENLAPAVPGFEFVHHDVYNIGLNPAATAPVLPFPCGDREFRFVNAWSVFTHLLEDPAVHYLREVARILRPDGIFQSTWFLFEKRDFPMMQEFQNALFINPIDLTNAVVFDREFLIRTAREAGLVITRIQPPGVRGYQWLLRMSPAGPGVVEAAFSADEAPLGIVRPPLRPHDAETIGH